MRVVLPFRVEVKNVHRKWIVIAKCLLRAHAFYISADYMKRYPQRDARVKPW
jgi:hypothetical protein